MLPKQSKDNIKPIAAELNIPEEDLEDIIREYFREIKANLSGTQHMRIIVQGLGYFIISHKKVEKQRKITKA